MDDKVGNPDYALQLQDGRDQARSLARTVTSPECLSASVLTICQGVAHTQVNEMVAELKEQSASIRKNDLSRVESMLIAQAHTLDGLFAKLASDALTSNDLGKLERYMKLALKAQSQSRATLHTLGEIKAPKQVSIVGQANIGNQVQVNNSNTISMRTREKQNEPNELLEVNNGERLDTRTTSKAGKANSRMETVDK